MTIGLIMIALVGLLAVVTHRRTRFEERVFKNVPVNDWMTLIVFPLVMFIGWAEVAKSIYYRPNIYLIPVDDFDFLIVMFIFMLYAFVGNSLHFVSKIIWRYLRVSDKKKMIYRVNEMFHGKLSHYLVFLTLIIFLVLLALFELNHPVENKISIPMVGLLIVISVIFGFAAAKSIFYTNQWYGGYNKPLSFFAAVALIILASFYKTLHISLLYYPVTFFIVGINISLLSAFILRQIFIFSRLRHRRRLQFLHKILSA